MLDLLIKNATVYDGTGAPPIVADIAVQDGKITAVGTVDQPATRVIDGGGLCASPGFIDVHGHSDLFAFADPDRASKLCQGITTEICGQCGLGPAPVSQAHYAVYEGYFKSQGAPIDPQSPGFTTFSAFLKRMEQMPLGIHMAYFIPHGTVRMAVLGLSPAPPTDEELAQMEALVRDGMEAGALGLSTGLMYAPGLFAAESELEALCRVVGAHGGIYTSHIRDQGDRLEESVAETLRVAKNAGARANISHHKASGRQNWGKVTNTTSMIHQAGFPAMHDVYPYAASSTMLRSVLPPDVQALGLEDSLAYLRDPANHAELEQAILNPVANFESPVLSCGYEGILIFDAVNTKDAIGQTVQQYAQTLGIKPFKALIKLLVDNALGAGYIGFSMAEQDVETLVADPLCMFGTDGLYIPGMPMTHPRAIGTFPRILGLYVREKGILSLSEAIRKMTSLPAQFYGLAGKGRLAPGMDADITLFDAEKVIDRADYRQPLLPNEGISCVVVDGVVAVEQGESLGVRRGRVLRRQKNGG